MRIEFSFKTTSELTRTIALTTQHCRDVIAFNIPNKIRNDNLIESAKVVKDSISNSHVCVHYSMKNNKLRRPTDTIDKLINFISVASTIGINDILLVSGGGKQKVATDTIFALKELSNKKVPFNGITISVAYNPYHPSIDEQEIEKTRLIEKLSYNIVTTVYLQFGTNTEELEDAIKFIYSVNPSINIIGSVFVPTKALLARFRFRPWSGMYLSEEFLQDVESADQVVRRQLEIYKKYNVEPIIESALRSEKEVEYMYDLLK